MEQVAVVTFYFSSSLSPLPLPHTHPPGDDELQRHRWSILHAFPHPPLLQLPLSPPALPQPAPLIPTPSYPPAPLPASSRLISLSIPSLLEHKTIADLLFILLFVVSCKSLLLLYYSTPNAETVSRKHTGPLGQIQPTPGLRSLCQALHHIG